MSDNLLAYSSADTGVRTQPPALRVYRGYTVRDADGSSVGRSTPEPHWVPQALRWRTNGGLSTLRLRRVLGAGADQGPLRAEDVQVAPGDRFRLVEVLSSQFASTDREWFRGHVGTEELLIQAGPGGDAEDYSVVCYGPELLLSQKVVLGQWLKKPDADEDEIAGTLTAAQRVREKCWQSHLPCAFNADGKPNASASAWKLDSDGDHYDPASGELACRVFEPPGRTLRDSAGDAKLQAEHWTAYTAVRSLIEWVDRYETVSFGRTNWEAIESLLGEVTLGEVCVHGMSLLEALAAVLLPVGFGFAVEPWAEADPRGRFGHRLLVFALSQPAQSKEPSLADNAGGNVPIDSAAGRRAAVQRLHFVRDSHRAANEVHVLGDQKRVQTDLDFGGVSEGAWELHPYWDTSAHSLASWLTDGAFNPYDMPGGSYTFAAFHQKYDLGGADYEQNRHAFRSFGWNEDGALAPVVSDLPDLSSFGDADGHYVRRPRPVGETYTFDHEKCQTRRMPASVWMALVRSDTGAVVEESWLLVPAQVWRGRAGLTLNVAKLAQWYPWARDEKLAGQTVPGTDGTKYQDLHYLTSLHNTVAAGSGTKLLMRLSGSIETDATLAAVAAETQAAQWPFASQRAVYAPHRFRWRARQSTGVWPSTLPADDRDDRDDAAAYADEIAHASAAAVGRCSLVLRHLTREYTPGVGIRRTADRRISLALDAEGERFPIVVGVVWDFAAAPGKTELTLNAPAPRTTP